MTKGHRFDAAHDTSAISKETHVSRTYRRKLIEVAADVERQRLFGVIEMLVPWKAPNPKIAPRAAMIAQDLV